MILSLLSQRKGMSIVELVVTLSILGVVMIPLSYLLYSSYTTYYQENDKMNCMAEVNDSMEAILDDIRQYEYQDNLTIVSPSSITVTTGVSFSYDIPNKKILRSGVSTLSGKNQTQILGFSVIERTTGFDSGIIEITIDAECGESGNVSLTNSYRRKKQ